MLECAIRCPKIGCNGNVKKTGSTRWVTLGYNIKHSYQCECGLEFDIWDVA
jgi:hypothetical protein